MARPKKNAQRQINEMLRADLFVQVVALSVAALAASEKRARPIGELFKSDLKMVLQNAMSAAGVTEPAALAGSSEFMDRVQPLADDLVSAMHSAFLANLNHKGERNEKI
ncbi:hypothetical protein [Ochrobactrum sp. AN78]|uniref:hypothetical protein n=1 Tax=Ochrobactrum sp. AN78 TaxID=3039853 RepID=UPI002989CF66|nr:hypothetical protein [Ochrobactrum sp. AN78]MDH7789162.1 hypothetical protein [Ochrobactrum sp. AN78]